MCADKKLEIPSRPPRVGLLDNIINNGKEFELLHKEAYKNIDNGITLVTEGKREEATEQLKHGLKLLDLALSIKIESFDVGAEQIQLYIEMQNKMKCTRKEVLIHFLDSESSGNSVSNGIEEQEAPPSYDEYLKSIGDRNASDDKPVSYPTLDPNDFKIQQDVALQEIMNYGRSPIVSPVLSPQSGELIFKIESGVQMFFVYSNGRVTSPSSPSFLAIFTFIDPICGNENTGSPGARGFIQVGEWNYPLVTAQSPVLHSFYGAYMFPDPNNSEPGTSVGILIPDTIDKDTLEMFEQIMIQMTSYKKQKVPEGVNADEESKKLMQISTSTRITEGAVSVSKGVLWSAEKLSELFASGSDKLKDSIQPEAQARQIDPKWQSTAKVARNVSGAAVKVSGFVLNQLGKATLAIGKKMAPAIQRHGTNAVGRLTGYSEKDTHAQVGGAMKIASGAVQGASTIYISLENAASILAKSVSDNTVKLVSHKYGAEYGAVTDDSLNAIGQTVMVGHNISSLGVKGIAKRTAKDTGKAVIQKYAEKSDEQMEGIEQAEEATENQKGNLNGTVSKTN